MYTPTLPATSALTSSLLLRLIPTAEEPFGLKCILLKKNMFSVFSFLQFTLGQTPD